jgi:hypothetical protein
MCGGIVLPFLTSALDVGERCHPPPPTAVPVSHCIRGWVGPRASLNAVKKIKSLPLLGINPRFRGHPSHFTDRAIPAPHSMK